MLILLLMCAAIGFVQPCKESDNCHCIESSHGKFVRAWRGPDSEQDWHVDMAPHCSDNEHWIIKERNGKVSLKSDDGFYLRARSDGSLYLAIEEQEAEMFDVQKNKDGSWSFHVDGRFLSANRNKGILDTMPHNLEWEQFKIHPHALVNSRRDYAITAAPTRGEGIEPFTIGRKSERRDKTTAAPTRGEGIEPFTIGTKSEPEPAHEAQLAIIKEILGESEETHAEVTLKSTSGKYLIGRQRNKCFFCLNKNHRAVSFSDEPSNNAEHWTVQQWDEKVILSAHHSDCLSGKKWVDLSRTCSGFEMWIPLKNEDGTWSFQSHEGHWLSADPKSDAAITVKDEGQRERFTLESWKSRSALASGRRRLRSVAHNNYLRAYKNDNKKVSMNRGPAKEWERWYIQDKEGTVVLRTIHTPARFVRDCSNAVVDLVDKPSKWENWNPIKNSDGSWSFQSVHGRWLAANKNGTVRTVKARDGLETSFILEWWTDLVVPSQSASTRPASAPALTLAKKVAGQRRFMSVSYGTYLRARDEIVNMAKAPANLWGDHWFIEESGGKVTIKTTTSLFLRDSSDGKPNLAKKARQWKQWTPLKNDDDSWSFKSAHGRWLSAQEDGSVKTTKTRGSAESFWIESWNFADMLD